MSTHGTPIAGAVARTGPIGVFDSGLGGLTVLRSLIDLLPHESVIYFGDTSRAPYGPKHHDDVMKHALEIGDLLVERGIRLLVVACNTATAVSLDALRDRFDVPVVGVIEPGVRAAVKATHHGRIGVIGTIGTINSGAYQRAITELGGQLGGHSDGESGPALEATCVACPGFVEFVEAGDVDSEQVHVLAERLLAPIREAEVDTLVLGCTHYPLLARTISDVMGRDVVLVSSADETAFAVQALLDPDAAAPSHGRSPSSGKGDRGMHTFLTSGDVETFCRLGAQFLGPEVITAEAWSWS